MEIKPGAQTKIFYRAQNLSARQWTGQAAYNVSPDQAGNRFAGRAEAYRQVENRHS